MATPLAVPAWPFVGGGHPIVAKLGKLPIGDLGAATYFGDGATVLSGQHVSVNPLVPLRAQTPTFFTGVWFGGRGGKR